MLGPKLIFMTGLVIFVTAVVRVVCPERLVFADLDFDQYVHYPSIFFRIVSPERCVDERHTLGIAVDVCAGCIVAVLNFFPKGEGNRVTAYAPAAQGCVTCVADEL